MRKTWLALIVLVFFLASACGGSGGGGGGDSGGGTNNPNNPQSEPGLITFTQEADFELTITVEDPVEHPYIWVEGTVVQVCALNYLLSTETCVDYTTAPVVIPDVPVDPTGKFEGTLIAILSDNSESYFNLSLWETEPAGGAQGDRIILQFQAP